MRNLASLPSLDGKRVIIRCDLNVPLDGDRITDDGRIVASVPTIKYLVEHGAKVVVISHLGRPDGEPNPKYSLAPAAARLGELLGQPVFFATDTVGSEAKGARQCRWQRRLADQAVRPGEQRPAPKNTLG